MLLLLRRPACQCHAWLRKAPCPLAMPRAPFPACPGSLCCWGHVGRAAGLINEWMEEGTNVETIPAVGQGEALGS